MKIKNRFWLCICLPALLFSACDVLPKPEPDPPGPPPEKAYHAEILWEREINRYIYIDDGIPLIEGQYCYIPTYENYLGGGSNIVKINMETGRVEWENRAGGGFSSEKPQKIDAHIYLERESGILFVYNDSDGKLAATVMLGNDETEAKNNDIKFSTPVAVSGPYLFWGNAPDLPDLRGLMRFNSALIDFSIAPNVIQNIAPELIWSNSWQARIYTDLIPEDRILYFLTKSYMPENPGVLIALDAETGDMIWEREVPHCQGTGYSSLVLNGDKLLVVEGTFSSYDKLTGTPVLENIPLGYEGRYSITLNNNRLFYSNNRWLISVNADTGALIWTVSPAEDTYFRTSPLVNNGQVFILHDTGLRVYNSDTGEFVGVDGLFPVGYLWRDAYAIAAYKDVCIFNSSDYVIAIRANMEEP